MEIKKKCSTSLGRFSGHSFNKERFFGEFFPGTFLKEPFYRNFISGDLFRVFFLRSDFFPGELSFGDFFCVSSKTGVSPTASVKA